MSVSSSGSGGGDCGPSLGRDCAGGTTRLSFTGGQNGPAEQDPTPWGDPGPSPQDAVSNVVLCTPPLPSVENTHRTVDGWWRQSAGASPATLDSTSAIRTTMVLHGCDIYSLPLTTGRGRRRRRSTPSPGDEDAEFTLSDVSVRRVATPSKHPASDQDLTADGIDNDHIGLRLPPAAHNETEGSRRSTEGRSESAQPHTKQEAHALALFIETDLSL